MNKRNVLNQDIKIHTYARKNISQTALYIYIIPNDDK